MPFDAETFVGKMSTMFCKFEEDRIELAIDGRRLLCLPYNRANELAAELGRASTALIDHMTAPAA